MVNGLEYKRWHSGARISDVASQLQSPPSVPELWFMCFRHIHSLIKCLDFPSCIQTMQQGLDYTY